MSEKVAQLDFLGIILNIGAFTALILAISFGGTEYAWSDGRQIALWVVGGVLLALFAVQQGLSIGTTPATRTFPVDFLRKKILIVLFCLMSAASTCVFVSLSHLIASWNSKSANENRHHLRSLLSISPSFSNSSVETPHLHPRFDSCHSSPSWFSLDFSMVPL
jgi:hypothetical protein